MYLEEIKKFAPIAIEKNYMFVMPDKDKYDLELYLRILLFAKFNGFTSAQSVYLSYGKNEELDELRGDVRISRKELVQFRRANRENIAWMYACFEDWLEGKRVDNFRQDDVDRMMARAEKGYFVRNLIADVVYCPGGAEMHRKSVKRDGAVRYASKHACRVCPYSGKCLKNKLSDAYPYKEIDFYGTITEKVNPAWFDD